MILIHQMGKVGSTAILHALQKQKIEAIQTHSLGEKNLYANIHAFLQPSLDIHRMKQEKELFFSQLIATKVLLDNKNNPETPLKIISLYREPFDRWISALTQNYAFHIQSANEFYFLQKGQEAKNDFISMNYAISQIFHILKLETLVNYREKWDQDHQTFWQKALGKKHPQYQAYLEPIEDKIYRLGSPEIHQYYWEVEHFDDPKASLLLRKLGAELLIPFYWFESNIKNLIGIDIYDYPINPEGILIKDNKIELLFIKFETLNAQPEQCETLLSNFTESSIKLEQVNVSKGKPGFELMQQLKEKYKPLFTQMKTLQLSDYYQHFYYNESN